MFDNRIPHLLETNFLPCNLIKEVKEGIMQAAEQIQKGMLLGELNAKFTANAIKEITPIGLRFEYNSTGPFAGVFNAHMTHTNNVFLRDDGTMDWESKGFWHTPEGDHILSISHGTGKETGPNTSKAEGEIVFTTRSPKLSWLNNKKFRVEVTGSLLTAEEHVKIFAL
jgi:PPE-repeat protein